MFNPQDPKDEIRLPGETEGEEEEKIEAIKVTGNDETLTTDDEKVQKDYGDAQIQVLEGLEAVRRRPGMYIGTTSQKGLNHLVYEIVDNSIDEALAGFCDRIDVVFHKDGSVSCKDNGRGIPSGIHPKMGVPTLSVVFTVLHAGGKFGGGGYKFSGGLHGVGAAVVNALSEWIEIDNCHDGRRATMRFERGQIARDFEVVQETGGENGLSVRFMPDAEIFTDTTVFDVDTILDRMREQAFLNAGVHIIVTDERGDEPKVSDFRFDGGIKDYVSTMDKERACQNLHEVVYMQGVKIENYLNEHGEEVTDEKKAEIAFEYSNTFGDVIVRSFVNNIKTPDGGTHEDGFRVALFNAINGYAKRKGFIKENEEGLKQDDIREGLCAVVSVKIENPQFEGQTKGRLGNSDVQPFVRELVKDKLEIFFEENPAVAEIIVKKAMMARNARLAAKRAIEAERKKNSLGHANMPEKLKDCNEKDPRLCELYVVEGDSAGGSAIGGRDSRFQAILSMWGKMLNVEKAAPEKVFTNEKLNPMILALGCGMGDELDLDRLRYHKIIIMADADVDGAHIRTLLLTFFFRFMRPLIEQGYVYSAVPPLYKLTRGKTVRVAYSDEERDKISSELRENNPNVKVDISRFKGLGEMDPHELWETTMDPTRRTLRRITMEDAVKADRVFNVLMGEEVEPRKEWIETNAQFALDLDI